MHNKNNILIQSRQARKSDTTVNNKLINNNVHINNTYQNTINNRTLEKNKNSNDNFVKNIIGQQVVTKDKKNNQNLGNLLENQKKLYEQENKILPKNLPYKIIMKEHLPKTLIQNPDLKNPHILEVHRVNKQIEADIDKFNEKLLKLHSLKKEHDLELQLEFNDDNFQKKKQQYDFSQAFIDNLTFESNDSRMKSDYVEYYENEKLKAEKKKKEIETLLSRVKNTPLLNENELF